MRQHFEECLAMVKRFKSLQRLAQRAQRAGTSMNFGNNAKLKLAVRQGTKISKKMDSPIILITVADASDHEWWGPPSPQNVASNHESHNLQSKNVNQPMITKAQQPKQDHNKGQMPCHWFLRSMGQDLDLRIGAEQPKSSTKIMF